MNIREEQCNKVCRILDDVLANRTTERDSLIVAVRKAFESLEQFGNSEPLPSAQPERKGYWIEMGTNKDGTHSIRCSKCGGGYKTRGHARSIATKAKYKFCPNCGADMRGEQDG